MLVPVSARCGVLIAGGGTAGAFAGISAAREGTDTLIIERRGALGGSQTGALVTPVMHSGIPGDPQSSALAEELRVKLQAMRGAVEGDANKGYFDPLALELALEDMVIESGCRLLYCTSAVGVTKDDGLIKKAVVFNHNGITAVEAKAFIDATADGMLSVLAGAAHESGCASGKNQAVSLRFIMEDVDVAAFVQFNRKLGMQMNDYPLMHAASVPGVDRWKLNPVFQKALEDCELTERDIHYFQCFSLPGRPNAVAFNCPELGARVNVLDPVFQTDRLIEGKRAIRRLAAFLRRRIPGFENATISQIAEELGVRESRRIICEHMLSAYDITDYAKPTDGIASSNYPIDIHGGDGGKLQFASVPADGKYYSIPLRSLVVKGLDNLLVAGRCIGADFIAQSSARVQGTCRATGEAAGIAASLVVKHGCKARDIDGALVRKIMEDRGAEFTPSAV